ncbi:FUSC family protein [Streptacidiphilus sp. 4-A2]|nr:FUSC family protein [Streptacidiphilus sp. 4-A2]
MLVVGFVLAFGAAAGPRLAGATPGLQLLYILPCFPPYAPQDLGERLGGMTLGFALLIAAEVFLLPDPRSPSYQELVARGAATAARCTRETATAPWILSAASVADATAAGQALRPSRVPEADRPAAPGVRDRALAHSGDATRVLLARLRELPAVPDPVTGPGDHTLRLLEQVAATADRSAHAMATGRADRSVGTAPLEEVLAEYHRGRVDRAEDRKGAVRTAVLRRQAALIEVAEVTVAMHHAVTVAIEGRQSPDGPGRMPFWYADQSAVRLWWVRLSVHLSPRSVYFQNAVRTGLGLAAARTVAAVVSLPHGFWAVLAALTLIRTTNAQTRTTVRQALTGTLLGAMAAAGLLVLTGHHTNVYAVILPLIMLATFCLAPLLGVGWAQGMFTLTVSTVFAQLDPAGWQLAEARFLAVLVGSLIGLVCGMLAWPRGAHNELRRDITVLLRAVAATITSTTGTLTDAPRPPTDTPTVHHALLLAESSFAQYQSEPQRPSAPQPDWQAALIAGYHAERGSQRLLEHRDQHRQDPPGEGALGPDTGAWLTGLADHVADEYRRFTDRLEAGGDGAVTADRPSTSTPGPLSSPGNHADTPATALPCCTTPTPGCRASPPTSPGSPRPPGRRPTDPPVVSAGTGRPSIPAIPAPSGRVPRLVARPGPVGAQAGPLRTERLSPA